jgi:hypothetical protein
MRKHRGHLGPLTKLQNREAMNEKMDRFGYISFQKFCLSKAAYAESKGK